MHKKRGLVIFLSAVLIILALEIFGVLGAVPNPGHPSNQVDFSGDSWGQKITSSDGTREMYLGWYQERNTMEISTKLGANGWEDVPLTIRPDTVVFNGKVGIGATDPEAPLTVVGGSSNRFTVNNDNILLKGNAGGNQYPYIQIRDASDNRAFYLGWGEKGQYVTFQLESGNDLYINGGNVGIGTSSPKATLSVGTSDQINLYRPSDNTLAIQTTLDDQSLGTYGGNTENRLILQPLIGYVGIGKNPSEKLDVAGNIKASGRIQASIAGGSENLASDRYEIAGTNIGAQTVYAYGSMCIGNPSWDCSGTTGVKLTSNQICLNSDCISSWPSAGSSYWTAATGGIQYSGGNVGIGTATAPSEKLDVAGNIKASGSITGTVVQACTTNGACSHLRYAGNNNNYLRGDTYFGDNNAVDYGVWKGNGDVGIGTTTITSGYKLDVAGNIKATAAQIGGATGVILSSTGIYTTGSVSAGSGTIGSVSLSGNSITANTLTLNGADTTGIRFTNDNRISWDNGAYIQGYNAGTNLITISSPGSILLGTVGETRVNNLFVADNGVIYLPKSNTAPFACTSSTVGAMYFDTSQSQGGIWKIPCVCIYKASSSEYVWKPIDDVNANTCT